MPTPRYFAPAPSPIAPPPRANTDAHPLAAAAKSIAQQHPADRPHHCSTTATATAAVVVSSKAPILAQRFRTKLCNNFADCGSCPYVHRCMFAHGKDELRSAGQNVADGLVSEEAIRAHKREQHAELRPHGNLPAGGGGGGGLSLRQLVIPGPHPLPLLTATAAPAGASGGAGGGVPSALVSVRIGRAPTAAFGSVATPTRTAALTPATTRTPTNDDDSPPSRDSTPQNRNLAGAATTEELRDRHCRYQHDPYAVPSPWAWAAVWCGGVSRMPPSRS